jgi:hypothetical protein
VDTVVVDTEGAAARTGLSVATLEKKRVPWGRPTVPQAGSIGALSAGRSGYLDGRQGRWQHFGTGRVSLARPAALWPAETERLLPIEWGEEINPQLQQFWAVKDILPREGLAVLYGHPGSGKSTLALDIAMHIALGRDWNSHKTRLGMVIYLAAEGQPGLRKRIAAFRQHHGLSAPNRFALIPTRADLFERDRQAFTQTIAVAAAKSGFELALIVVDTVSLTLGNGRENTDDLAVYVAFLSSLAVELRCCVLLIHHRPKDAVSREPRGHGSLGAAVDTALLIHGRAMRTVSITKQRDGLEGECCRFNLRSVRIGFDEDGEPVWSSVVDYVGGSSRDDRPPPPRRARETQGRAAIVLEALREELALSEGTPPEIPPGITGNATRAARQADVMKRAADGLRTTSDIKPDSITKAVRREFKYLEKAEKVAFWGEYMWLLD